MECDVGVLVGPYGGMPASIGAGVAVKLRIEPELPDGP